MDKKEIITLCGSTRFKDEFLKVYELLSLKGHIVYMPGLFGHALPNGGQSNLTQEQMKKLNELHKLKIDRSNCILVLDINKYIGDSTKSEIDYALSKNKPVYYISELK